MENDVIPANRIVFRSSSFNSAIRFPWSPIWLVAVAALVLFGASLAWTSYVEYRETLSQEFRLLESHAHFGGSQIDGALRSIDLLLQSVIQERLAYPSSSTAMHRQQVNLLQQVPEIHFLITTDKDGQVVTAESLNDPANVNVVRRFNASQRDYFTFHRDAKPADYQRAFLSRPFKTITNHNTIALSRAIRDKSGRFLGVALVGLSPEFFVAVLKQALPNDAGSSAILVNRFGDAIYQIAGGQIGYGGSVVRSAAFQEFIRSDQPQSRHIGAGILDGAQRMMVYSNVGQSQLAVVVTSKLEAVLATWWQNLLAKALMFSITALATLALTWGTRRRQLERRHAEAELRIAATAFESQEATMVTDAHGIVLRVNRAFTETTGYAPEEIIGKTPKLLHSGRHDAAFYRAIRNSLERTGAWQGEVWNRRKNGELYPKWLTISAVRDRRGVVTHYIGTDFDVSERKQAEETINALAFYDQLTGLPNRALFADRLKQTANASERSGSCCALLMIDLDNFRALNDTHGHEAGDLLLMQVAERLRAFECDNCTIARLGGDEFVVVLPNLSANEREAATATEALADKIVASLIQPYAIGDHVYHGSASIGAAVYKGGESSFDQLMKQAELAMYRAKSTGHNVVRFYDQEMEAAVRYRMELENDLRHAISAEQFLLHYQPQVIGEGRVTGAEVLVRWQHPSRGLMPPAEFIPLAEETDLILPLGNWVLKIACERLALWATRPELAHLTISVNVSASQFRRPDFVDRVLSIVDQTGADPQHLKLELTESLLVHDIEGVIEKMYALRAKGIRFSLDDFGTGYSSLSYLKRLPLDQLKIDQSFVREVLNDANAAAIAKTIVALGQSLGLAVIAEGVETSAERAFLASLGCHAYQGVLFGRPVADTQFERLSCQARQVKVVT